MRRRRVLVALLAMPWAMWALARTLALDTSQPAVALISFTPIVAATAVLPVLVALVAREWLVATLAAIALAALAIAVVPRMLDGPQPARDAAPERTLVVMTANILFGEADSRSILRLVREHDVDVLSLQELTSAAVVRLDAAGAREVLPGRALRPQARASGVGLMARGRLGSVASSGSLQTSLALPGGGDLQLVAVHPFPPISATSERDWRAVLRALPGSMDEGRPHLLLGDFNATLDHRELRRVLDRGYTDAADATGGGLVPTFPAGRPFPIITIDHVLAPRSFGVRRVSVHDVAGSDHRAVIAELVLPDR